MIPGRQVGIELEIGSKPVESGCQVIWSPDILDPELSTDSRCHRSRDKRDRSSTVWTLHDAAGRWQRVDTENGWKTVGRGWSGQRECGQPPADKSLLPEISHAHYWHINKCMWNFSSLKIRSKRRALDRSAQVPHPLPLRSCLSHEPADLFRFCVVSSVSVSFFIFA